MPMECALAVQHLPLCPCVCLSVFVQCRKILSRGPSIQKTGAHCGTLRWRLYFMFIEFSYLFLECGLYLDFASSAHPCSSDGLTWKWKDLHQHVLSVGADSLRTLEGGQAITPMSNVLNYDNFSICNVSNCIMCILCNIFIYVMFSPQFVLHPCGACWFAPMLHWRR